MAQKSLEQRVRDLEAVEEIRALKSRYFNCCDRKDPKGMRACFTDSAHIDYGAVGTFDNPDDLVKAFTQAACHDHMVELHHGVNAQIDIVGAERAQGIWSLHYQLINTKDNTLTQLAGYYEDEYRRVSGGWRISRTRFVPTSTLALNLAGEDVKKLVAGRPPRAT